MSDRDEPTLDALATKISELHSYNGNEQAAAADEAFDAVADLLAKKSKALGKAERERDEANEACREKQAIIERMLESEKKAVALMHHARAQIEMDNPPGAGKLYPYFVMRAMTEFIDGQPAPAKVAVDDAMVERAMRAHMRYEIFCRESMRAALVAALEGKT